MEARKWPRWGTENDERGLGKEGFIWNLLWDSGKRRRKTETEKETEIGNSV
jgi:hypothetical protein